MLDSSNELVQTPVFSPHKAIPTGRAWGYFRYSDDRLQREDSIEQQLRACREGASRNGQIIPADCVFADPGEKGWMESRPELDRMMDLIRTDKARPTDIYFFDTSRAARSMEFALRLQRFFDFYRIKVHFVANGMTSGSNGFKLQHAVHALMDEQQCVTIGQNVKRGHLNQYEKGCFAMSRVYGYDHEDVPDPLRADSQGFRTGLGRRLVINPAEAEVVRSIYRLYLSGLGFSAVATHLNKLGIKSPRIPNKNAQRTWRTGAVRSILTNPKYTGLIRYGVMEARRNPETSKVVNVRRPASEVREYRDESIRIISDEDFEAVVRLRRSRDTMEEKRKAAGFNKARSVYPWSGLLYCGECGGLINICQPSTYICVTAYRGGNCKNRQKLNRESFQQCMVTLIAGRLRDSTTLENLLEPLQEEICLQQREAAKVAESRRLGRGAVESKLAKVERSLTNLVVALEDNPSSMAISERLAQLEVEKALLLEQLAGAGPDRSSSISESDVRAYLQDALENLDLLLQGDLQRFRDELRRRKVKITLTPTAFEGEPAWVIAGELNLFGGAVEKIVGDKRALTSQHFLPALSLTDTTFSVSKRGNILKIVQPEMLRTEFTLPLAA